MHAIEVPDSRNAAFGVSRNAFEGSENSHASESFPNFNAQPVIRETDIVGQRCFGVLVREIVAQVRQKRAPRLKLFRDSYGSLQRRVRRVRFMTKGIEKQHVQTSQL